MTTTLQQGRRGRRARAPRETGPQQLPWRQVTNPLKPIEILSREQVETIHRASLKILRDMGIEVMSEEALRLLKKAGAIVDFETQVVRFDPEMVEETAALAPAEFTLTPRNPDHRITLGGKHVNFGLISGPPNAHDCERGRRPATYEDYCDLIRLAQSFNIIHFIGNQAVAPLELSAETRHLDCYLANVVYADRVYGCPSIGRARALDGVDMMAISRGISREQMVDSPGVVTIINVNSPRRLDGAMAEGLMTMAEMGQPVVVTPFTLMGAMTPVTLPAALAQQNAEALAGIVLTQLVRPGTPVVYGCFTSNVDLKSGAPAFGTPENAQAILAGGQMARRYGLPYRASNANASNTVDAQATYESQMSLWSAVMGGAHYINHGAGWLEGGLTASFEKIVLDAEMLQIMAETLVPIEFDEDSLALESIQEVEPGGHFFGTAHTIERFATAFYQPILADWRNFESWEEAGSKTATERATEIWKDLLKNYEAPAMDAAIREELDAFVARRKEEIARDGL